MLVMQGMIVICVGIFVFVVVVLVYGFRCDVKLGCVLFFGELDEDDMGLLILELWVSDLDYIV